MFCPNCGKQLEDTVKFCDGCGAKVAEEAATTQTAGTSGDKPLVAFKIAGIDFSISMTKIDIISLIAAIVGIIALFLPYASVSIFGFSESINFYEGSENSGFILVLLIAFIVLNVFGFDKIKTIVGYVYFAFIVIAAISFVSEIKEYLGSYSKDLISYGAGFWLLIISSIVLAFWGLVKKLVLKK